MRKIILLLVFVSIYFQAQRIEDKDVYKKCRNEFNKKTCLSDEDKDGILFYLDKCPKDSGFKENNGCPWADSDGDGILDKDDACPTVSGVPELNGCPKSDKTDCKLFREKQAVQLEKFSKDHQNIEEIYNLINKRVLDDVIQKRSKKDIASKETYIYIKYINNKAYFDEKSCFDGISQEDNFLITKFWNKNVLEYAQKKYNKEIFLSTVIPKDSFDELHKMIGDESFNYIKPYYDSKIMKVKIPARQESTLEIPIPIVVRFITPYKIEANDTKNNTIYEYKNNKWELGKN